MGYFSFRKKVYINRQMIPSFAQHRGRQWRWALKERLGYFLAHAWDLNRV